MLQKPNKHIDWNIDEARELMLHRCTCISNTQGIYCKTRCYVLFKVQKRGDLYSKLSLTVRDLNISSAVKENPGNTFII